MTRNFDGKRDGESKKSESVLQIVLELFNPILNYVLVQNSVAETDNRNAPFLLLPSNSQSKVLFSMSIFNLFRPSKKHSKQTIEADIRRSTEDMSSSAVDTFETVLRELRVPPRSLIAAAVREIFQRSRQERVAVGQEASQLHSDIQMNFSEFLRVHEDSDAFNDIQDESSRLLKSNQ